MKSRVFTVLALVIVLGMYAAGLVILVGEFRGTDTPAPLGIVGGGALVMFASVLAFAVIFAKAATVND